jgi:hypothetical protein
MNGLSRWHQSERTKLVNKEIQFKSVVRTLEQVDAECPIAFLECLSETKQRLLDIAMPANFCLITESEVDAGLEAKLDAIRKMLASSKPKISEPLSAKKQTPRGMAQGLSANCFPAKSQSFSKNDLHIISPKLRSSFKSRVLSG